MSKIEKLQERMKLKSFKKGPRFEKGINLGTQ
jgi:hypothetical protein